jgi:hypothetical protein
VSAIPPAVPGRKGVHPRLYRPQGVVILRAPTTLIGTRSQFDPPPQWWSEEADVLPDWYLEILETPAQAARFFRHAAELPERPHLGFVGFSTASLACGWEHATVQRQPLPEHKTVSPAQAQYRALLDARAEADAQLPLGLRADNQVVTDAQATVNSELQQLSFF